MVSRRVHGAALLAAAFLLSAPAASQTYPSKPVRIVVPSAPGGGSDIAARTLAPQLGQALRGQVLVDNRPGPSGNVAAETVAKAPADGYTLLLATSTLAINPALMPKLSYDSARDFVPVGAVMSAPLVLLVPPSLQVKSVKELLAFAKTQPRGLKYGYSGTGSADRLCGELFAKVAGLTAAGVPYKDEAQSGRPVLVPDIHYAFAGVAHAVPHVKAGQARALAITTARRYPLLPAVPALSETHPGFEFPVWQALLAPARTPPAVLRQIELAVMKAMDNKEVVERLTAHGLQPVATTPEELRAFLPREIARWNALVRESNVRTE